MSFTYIIFYLKLSIPHHVKLSLLYNLYLIPYVQTFYLHFYIKVLYYYQINNNYYIINIISLMNIDFYIPFITVKCSEEL